MTNSLSPVQQIILTCLLGPEDPKAWDSFFRKDENQRYRGALCRAAKACPEGKKVCRRCRLPKDKDQFSRGTMNTDGLNSYCSFCSRRAANKSTLRNLEKVRERERVRNSCSVHRGERLLCNYGITLGKYNALLAEQGGVCAICKKEESSKKKKNLSVDHDHSTGIVRGLLCHQCNSGLGMFKESSSLTQAATEYLVRTR